MIWWIVGICLFIAVTVFVALFVRGADSRKVSPWMKQVEDDAQEKAVSQMKKPVEGIGANK